MSSKRQNNHRISCICYTLKLLKIPHEKLGRSSKKNYIRDRHASQQTKIVDFSFYIDELVASGTTVAARCRIFYSIQYTVCVCGIAECAAACVYVLCMRDVRLVVNEN